MVTVLNVTGGKPVNIRFLGTAAAEGIPAIFCQCPVCRAARAAGGRELRTRSGAIVDGHLKLDFGPDSCVQAQRCGLDYGAVESVLVTHSHFDHFSVGELEFRSGDFCHGPDGGPLGRTLTFYGDSEVCRMVRENTDPSQGLVACRQMVPFEPVDVEGYTVTPLEAVHCWSRDPAPFPVVWEGRTVYRYEDALIYLIEKDGASLLYAHDTGEFTDTDMEFLAGRRVGLISLDCTAAAFRLDYNDWMGHMSYDGCLRMRDRLLACGAADSATVFAANHFSHNGYTTFEDMERLLPGFVVSYDGLTLEVPRREGA